MTTLSQVYKNFPLHLNQIIPIDFDSVGVVPDSHVWPHSGDITDRLSIPTIDLLDPDATELIGHACEKWGVFQVINHGVKLKLLDEVEAETRHLFSLPATQKLKALRAPGGATGYGIARISHFFNKYMWHEGFTMMGSPIVHARELWPIDYHNFCNVMEEYQKKMKQVAETLMHLILEYIGLSEHKMEGSSSALQLNSYPLCPNPDRAMGLAPHTDTSLLTILHQTTTQGLQIWNEQQASWVSVNPSQRGALIVNVGDFLHILSNGRYVSVLHRVVMKESIKQRLSTAYFYSPPSDYNVFPFAPSSFPLYKSVSVSEYFQIKAKNLDKPLSSIRLL
ncbi:2-oxoglutarate (2OG) and Fe(II)-dependent oxygenase superfamily protein [Euphorbia peplus]|nr:2-oxoglutarate (2OG) and Fe(II)-dependent oxygenase superfamily protein [Euphorbia peplus]